MEAKHVLGPETALGSPQGWERWLVVTSVMTAPLGPLLPGPQPPPPRQAPTEPVLTSDRDHAEGGWSETAGLEDKEGLSPAKMAACRLGCPPCSGQAPGTPGRSSHSAAAPPPLATARKGERSDIPADSTCHAGPSHSLSPSQTPQKQLSLKRPQ